MRALNICARSISPTAPCDLDNLDHSGPALKCTRSFFSTSGSSSGMVSRRRLRSKKALLSPEKSRVLEDMVAERSNAVLTGNQNEVGRPQLKTYRRPLHKAVSLRDRHELSLQSLHDLTGPPFGPETIKSAKCRNRHDIHHIGDLMISWSSDRCSYFLLSRPCNYLNRVVKTLRACEDDSDGIWTTQ